MKPYFEENGVAIYHGRWEDVMPTLPPPDLVLTDPPYSFTAKGGGFHADGHKNYQGGRTYLAELEGINCTDFEPAEFLNAIKGECLVACMNKELVDVYIAWARARAWLFDIHVMTKTNPIPAKSTHFLHDLEYLVMARKPGSFFSGAAPFDCYRKHFSAYNDGEKLHPAQKPVGLMTKYVLTLCPESGLVLDPFMGSGTTLVAARAVGRRAIGIEREEKYCEVAANRLGQGVLFA